MASLTKPSSLLTPNSPLSSFTNFLKYEGMGRTKTMVWQNSSYPYKNIYFLSILSVFEYSFPLQLIVPFHTSIPNTSFVRVPVIYLLRNNSPSQSRGGVVCPCTLSFIVSLVLQLKIQLCSSCPVINEVSSDWEMDEKVLIVELSRRSLRCCIYLFLVTPTCITMKIFNTYS